MGNLVILDSIPVDILGNFYQETFRDKCPVWLYEIIKNTFLKNRSRKGIFLAKRIIQPNRTKSPFQFLNNK